MWLAHAVTLSRLPIAVAFWWAYGSPWAIGLIALAALTDTLDGRIARALKWRGARGPDIGGWLDPLVDKLFVAIVLGVLWLRTGDALVIALIGARELVMVPLVAIYLARSRPRSSELQADFFGKVATVAQFVALAIVLGHPTWGLAAAIGAAVLGLIAAGHYIGREVGRMHRYTRPSSQREMSITASSAR
jgi:cardiolipin synthase